MPVFTHECLGSHMNTDGPMKGKTSGLCFNRKMAVSFLFHTMQNEDHAKWCKIIFNFIQPQLLIGSAVTLIPVLN